MFLFSQFYFFIWFIFTTRADLLRVRPVRPVSVTSHGNRQCAESIPASDDSLWQGARFESWGRLQRGWIGSPVLAPSLLCSSAQRRRTFAAATRQLWRRWWAEHLRGVRALFALGESRDDEWSSLGGSLRTLLSGWLCETFYFELFKREKTRERGSRVSRKAMVKMRDTIVLINSAFQTIGRI